MMRRLSLVLFCMTLTAMGCGGHASSTSTDVGGETERLCSTPLAMVRRAVKGEALSPTVSRDSCTWKITVEGVQHQLFASVQAEDLATFKAENISGEPVRLGDGAFWAIRGGAALAVWKLGLVIRVSIDPLLVSVDKTRATVLNVAERLIAR